MRGGPYSTSVGLARPSYPAEQKDGTKANASSMLFTARFDTQRLLSKKAARMGDEGKAVGCVPPTAFAG
jgi:hypothetical protein